MNNTVKNYYILQSKWLPQNVVMTFQPFIINLIISENIKSTTIEALSKAFLHKYGYKIEMFILRPVLNNLKQEGLASLEKEQWKFEIQSMPQVDLDHDAAQFSEKYNALVQGFVNFCSDPQEVPFSIAENIILSFIEDNNIDPKVYTGNGEFYDEKDVYRYFLSEYIKDLKQANNPLFDFLVSLCESMLIKSYIFNDGLNSSAFESKTLFIDTPIIFRLLGYYGEYYQNEYEFLIRSLIEKKCKIYIFQRNYDEVLKVLRTAEKYVESTIYDMSKSSDVCNYFRSQRMRAEDIGQEIELLKTNLSRLGIELFNESINWQDSDCVENHDVIRNKIIEEYKLTPHRFIPEDAISIDANSTLDIYALRNNNSIHVLSDAPSFYVSSNFGFVNAIRKYNNENYHDTISPVISDAFIGMIISGENANKAKEVARNKILSFCYSAFRPTQAMKEKFMSILESEKAEDRISEYDYIALRNHAMVNDFLIKSTRNSIEELSNDTIYEVLDMVKAAHVIDAKNSFDKQLQDERIKHQEEIASVKATNNAEIERLKRKNYEDRIKNARREFEDYKKKVKVRFLVFLSVVAFIFGSGTIVQTICLFKDAISKLAIISAIFTAILTIISIVTIVISLKKSIEQKWLKKKILKKKFAICNENELDENDIS